jgi:glucosamine kinase
MSEFLAVDAGGTSTRAVVVGSDGRCLGYGRAAGGNPTSHGADRAVASVVAAVEQALTLSNVDRASIELVVVAHAGGHSDYVPGIQRGLAALGVHARIRTAGDLLALFTSGTHETEGAALIAGTGAIGGAVRGGELARTVDGTGWLLGDSGSGFWIGHRIARAVVDDLDGGRPTGLTPLLLARLGLQHVADGTLVQGRPPVLGRLITTLYELRPVQLSAFAPLAFQLAGEDQVASEILREAVSALAALLHRVRREQAIGPLVLGGSVLIEGVLPLDATFTGPLLDAIGPSTPIPVKDGLVGAAVLALRAGQVPVDAGLFATLASGIGTAGASWLARTA